jgi:transposase
MEIKKRRVFDKEFKQRTVSLIESGDKSAKEVALDLGIDSGNIYRWIREYKDDPQESFPGKGKLKPEEEELRRLKRQLADVTEERDILKKAVAIFSKVKQ